MGFIYLGFDLQSMLAFIAQFNKETKLYFGGEVWNLVVVDNNGNPTEFTGCLTEVVTKAFKPHLQDARAERKRFQLGLRGLHE